MKKYFILVLAMVIVGVAVGCGQPVPTPNPTTTPIDTTATEWMEKMIHPPVETESAVEWILGRIQGEGISSNNVLPWWEGFSSFPEEVEDWGLISQDKDNILIFNPSDWVLTKIQGEGETKNWSLPEGTEYLGPIYCFRVGNGQYAFFLPEAEMVWLYYR